MVSEVKSSYKENINFNKLVFKEMQLFILNTLTFIQFMCRFI